MPERVAPWGSLQSKQHRTLPRHLARSASKAGHVRSSCLGTMFMRCVRSAAVPCAYAHRTLKSIRLRALAYICIL